MSGRPDKNASEVRAETPLFWVTRRGALIALVLLHAAALVAVIGEFLFPFPQDGHAVERLHALDFTASYSAYGFVACVLLVLLGILLRRVVMRDERYYEGDDA